MSYEGATINVSDGVEQLKPHQEAQHSEQEQQQNPPGDEQRQCLQDFISNGQVQQYIDHPMQLPDGTQVSSSIQFAGFPSDTMYRCASCSFVHSEQAKVVAHAKSCPSGVHGATTNNEGAITMATFKELLTIEPGLEEGNLESEMSDGVFEMDELQGGQDPMMKRGRGLPLWTDNKISVLLDGVQLHAHIFKEDFKHTRRAWKTITKYTKINANFKVSSKQCSYKWNKLLSAYQDYLSDPQPGKKPKSWDRVHAIVTENEKILKKPDIHSYIRTITKVATDEPDEEEEGEPTMTTENKVPVAESEAMEGEQDNATTELVDDSALNDTMEDCAQISINEGCFDVQGEEEVVHASISQINGDGNGAALVQDSNYSGPSIRLKIWTKQRVQTLLAVIKRYQGLLLRQSPVMINYTWSHIAVEVSKVEKFSVSGDQCYQKWKNLKRAHVLPRHQNIGRSALSEAVRELHHNIKLKSERGEAAYDEDDDDDDDCDRSESPEDCKKSDPQLLQAVHEMAEKAGQSKATHGGFRMLFWTDKRLEMLLETVMDHCYLMDAPTKKSRDAWQLIAASVSEKGKFSVDFDRCLRKFRQLVRKFIINRSPAHRPSYYHLLLQIVKRLPAHSKSLPQKNMPNTSTIKTNRYVEVSVDSADIEGQVDDDMFEQELADQKHIGNFTHNAGDNEALTTLKESYMKLKKMSRRSNGIVSSVPTDSNRRNSGVKRKVDEDCGLEDDDDDDADASDTDTEQRITLERADEDSEDGDYMPPAAARKRKKRNNTNSSNNNLGEDSGSSCLEVLQRMERSMHRHNVKVERSLESLTSNMAAIDATLKTTSTGLVSFLLGFSQTFDKLTDLKSRELRLKEVTRNTNMNQMSSSDSE